MSPPQKNPVPLTAITQNSSPASRFEAIAEKCSLFERELLMSTESFILLFFFSAFLFIFFHSYFVFLHFFSQTFLYKGEVKTGTFTCYFTARFVCYDSRKIFTSRYQYISFRRRRFQRVFLLYYFLFQLY